MFQVEQLELLNFNMRLGLGLGLDRLRLAIGAAYVKVGRVLDYATSVGVNSILDQSGEGNDATLYTGRHIGMDGVNDTINFPTGYTSAERTATVWMRVDALGDVLLNGVTGTFTFEPTATGIWEELSSTATVSGDLAFAVSRACEVSDLRIGDEHWELNNWSDNTADGLNGLSLPDSGPNDLHATCSGCYGGTGEGIDPEVAGIVGYDDAQWFNGVDTQVDLDSDYTFSGDFKIGFTLSPFQGSITDLLYRDNDMRIWTSSGGQIRFENDGTFPVFSPLLSTTDVNYVTISRIGSDVTVDINGDSDTNTINSSDFVFSQIGRSAANKLVGFLINLTDNDVPMYSGQGSTAWDNLNGTNDGTPSGTFVTVGQKRATIPQTAGRNWNKYWNFPADQSGTVDYGSPAGWTNSPVEFRFATTSPSSHILGTNPYSITSTIFVTVGKIRLFHDGSDRQAETTIGLNDGQFHVVYYDGIDLTIDDVVQSFGAGTGINSSSNKLTLGGRGNSWGFIGTLFATYYGVELQKLPHTIAGDVTRQLVSESDTNDQIDAYGTAILNPRPSTKCYNLFKEGETVQSLSGTTGIQSDFKNFWWDGVGSDTITTYTGAISFTQTAGTLGSNGITAPIYYVNGGAGSTLSAGWNTVGFTTTTPFDATQTIIARTGGTDIHYNDVKSADDMLTNHNELAF